jgi:pyruvate-ferredoxin/flavodoxin oxidoreductase
MTSQKKEPAAPGVRYPGVPAVLDGAGAVVAVETVASDTLAGAPSPFTAPIAAGWGHAVAAGAVNGHGRRLLALGTESDESTAAAVSGIVMTGARAAAFATGDGAAAMHAALAAAVGKRLPWVLHLVCRPLSRHAAPVGAGHDDYHAIADTGAVQLFAKNVQEVADLALIAHRVAELALTPGVCAQDAGLTSATLESLALAEPALVREFLGKPDDLIDAPTPAQQIVFGARRRRVPERFDHDRPVMLGGVQRADAWAQGAAAQRPYYFDHVAALADRSFKEFAALTGRAYARCAGYRVEDAEYVIVAQGSVVADAEAVADYLRAAKKCKVGVVNLTMFRPFPADLLVALLSGRRGALVVERVDQPLAAEAPVLREARAALACAVENGRARRGTPHPGLPACSADEVPEFYSACFGLGGRELRPADLVAAVQAMRDGARRRHVYLGIDFVRKGTRLPKLQIWQEQLLDRYPDITDLALAPATNGVVRAESAVAVLVHAAGGRSVASAGTRVLVALAEALGLRVKAGPSVMPERGAELMTVHATFAREPVRSSGGPVRVDGLVVAEPSVLGQPETIAPVLEGGAIVVRAEGAPEDVWQALPAATQRAIQHAKLRLFTVDAAGIAASASSDPGGRGGAAVAALVGAWLRVSALGERERLPEATVFERLGRRLAGPGSAGTPASADLLAAVRAGYAGVRELDVAAQQTTAAPPGVPQIPAALERSRATTGAESTGRFWEQVGYLYRTGQDGLADPFAALGVLPAATASIRDLTPLRREVPALDASRCTGCGACWTQCPDAAIPAVVNGIDEVLRAAIGTAAAGRPVDRLRQLVRPLAEEARRLLRVTASMTFAEALPVAFANVVDKLGWDAERRAAVERDVAPVVALVDQRAPVRTEAFFDGPESRERGAGGLLVLGLNPETCKACGICVEVCPERALAMVPQTADVVDRLRHGWRFWQDLPDTADRWVDPAALDANAELLPRLLLKKASYGSLVGGDGACAGCGEKTAMHLVLAAVHALVLPRVTSWIAHLDEVIAGLDAKARTILASDADLATLSVHAPGPVDVTLDQAKRAHVERLSAMLAELRDIRWRYADGPTGRGRAACGVANAAGCSALWGGTYPYNPYPFPWVQHVGHDAPAVALGIFEGQMERMARVFGAVRRAELELAGEYDPATHDAPLASLDWRRFTDDEMALCPPVVAVGGDGAMLDRGLHALSTVLTSGRPIRIVVLDTGGHASDGGQPSSTAFCGQASAAARAAEQTRKEAALLAIAHRNVFVLQSSAAAPAHLLGGVLKALRSRTPSLLVLHAPCPPSHGVAPAMTPRAARLAVESRAVPLLLHDPARGTRLAERLSLDGNPAPEQAWTVWDVAYVDDAGVEQRMQVPLTVADWAAGEARFQEHFASPPADDDAELVPFAAWLELAPDDRAGKLPFIFVLGEGRRLERRVVGEPIVRLAEDRQQVWSLLRDLAGFGEQRLAAEHRRAVAGLRAEHEAQMADLKARYPRLIARRLAEVIVRGGNGAPNVADLLARADAVPVSRPEAPAPAAPSVASATAVLEAPAVPVAPAPPAEDAKPLVMEPYIDSEMCTACNECTNLNKRLFAYNAKKQAYVKDARAGTFKDLVVAAEKCPVHIIHPGTPLKPGEKDVDKWIERARPFN